MSAVVAAAQPVAVPKPSPPSPKKAPASPQKPDDKKKRRGRAGRAKKGKKGAEEPAAEEDAVASSFDCSSAIAKVSDSLWVSAVSGTRMGASLEATLLECGVTAVVSTLEQARPVETFQHLPVDTSATECGAALHEACDFIDENVQEGGAVFIHSRSGFARSEWAVLLALGYLVKYESTPLRRAVERLSEATKRAISPASRFRKELAEFEEEALGEASVDQEWIEDTGEQPGRGAAFETTRGLAGRGRGTAPRPSSWLVRGGRVAAPPRPRAG